MLKMFSVYDKAVGAFMQPFFVRANGEALRTFTDAVNDVQSPFYKHSADFELHSIASFDPQNGRVIDVELIRVIAAIDLINKM